MAQIHALTPEGRLPSQAVAHVQEIVAPGVFRDIASLFDPNLVTIRGRAWARWSPTGQLDYTFSGFEMSGTSGVAMAWGTLPPGYRPPANQVGSLTPLNGSGNGLELTFNLGGGIAVQGAVAGRTYSGNVTIFTDGTTPTAHPGTPA